MKLTEAFKEEVKNVLINMAESGDLDGDISQLCIDTVFEQATEALIASPTLHEVESLLDFTCVENPGNALAVLKVAQTEGKGDDLADYFIDMAEMFEETFTVSELLEIIKPK